MTSSEYQAIRPSCDYGVKVCDEGGKYRGRRDGDTVVYLMSTDAEVEYWHLHDCACGRGEEYCPCGCGEQY